MDGFPLRASLHREHKAACLLEGPGVTLQEEESFSTCFQQLHPCYQCRCEEIWWCFLPALSPSQAWSPPHCPPKVDSAYSPCHQCTNSFSILTHQLQFACSLGGAPFLPNEHGKTNEPLRHPVDCNHPFSNKVWSWAMSKLPWLCLSWAFSLKRRALIAFLTEAYSYYPLVT